MLKKIAIFTLLLSLASPICTDGCIQCDQAADSCTVCDTSLNFVLEKGHCVRVEIDNCEAIDIEGNCVHCRRGLYLDPKTRSCLHFPRNAAVANCTQYTNHGQCIHCASGFFLGDGFCLPVPATIANCTDYGREGLSCVHCAPGTFLNADGSACTAAAIDNCIGYSSITCNACKPGFKLNQNAYIDLLTTVGPLQLHHYQYLLHVNVSSGSDLSYPVCQPLSVPHCAEHLTYTFCSICEDGFYLDAESGQCHPNPVKPIANCTHYLNANTCIECAQSMYLANGTTCSVPLAPVSNCDTYNSSSTSVICLTCHSGYYLSEPNICTRRTSLSKIANCVTLAIKSETCEECASGFELTTDSAACLPEVPNCKIYVPSIGGVTLKLTCDVCDNGYFYSLTQSSCVRGSKDFCDVYQKNENLCQICTNKFYQVNGSCFPHNELYFCDKYDSLTQNKCETCLTSSFLFSIQKLCVPVTPIDHCERYATQTTCAYCEDNYALNVGATACDLIPFDEFCMQKVGANCVRCYPNYVLKNDGTCQLFDDELLFFCASNNLDGLIAPEALKCNYCRESSIPMNYNNLFSCVANWRLSSNFFNQPNCLQFDSSANCLRCAKGWALYNNACRQNCLGNGASSTFYLQQLQGVDSDGNGSVDSYRVSGANVCGSTITGCEVAVPDLNQSPTGGISYSCIKCLDGFVSKILLSVGTYTNTRYIRWNGSFETSETARYPSLQCVAPVSAGVTVPSVRPLVNNAIEFCEFYDRIDSWLGCVKCEHTYSGVAMRNVFGCRSYDHLGACLACMQGFQLASTTQCLPVTPVTNCARYFEGSADGCMECDLRFVLSGSTTHTAPNGTDVEVASSCVPRVADQIYKCISYKLAEETCLTCDDGFVLAADALSCVKIAAYCKELNGVNCKKCIDGYYLKSLKCYQGQIANCRVYGDATIESTENICTACQNGFYLKNNACILHVPMPNCNITDPTTANTCKRCNNNFLRFTVKTHCDTNVNIPNCLEYSSIYECSVCASGFYLSNYATRCLPIPASSGCLTIDSNNHCTLCKGGYFLKDNNCINVHSDVLANCNTTLGPFYSNTNTSQECPFCLSNPANGSFFYEPLDLKTSTRCVEPAVIKESIASHKLIDNCQRYGLTAGNAFACVQCAAPYVLAEDQLSCITEADCFAIANKVIFLSTYTTAQYFAYANGGMIKATGAICTATIASVNAGYVNDNCYLAPSLTQDPTASAINYYCARCKPGFVATFYTDTTTFGSTGEFVNQYKIGEVPTTYTVYPAVNCVEVPSVTETVLGTLLANKTVAYCQYYYHDTTAHTLKCISCQWGFRGRLSAASPSYIDHCEPVPGCNTSVFYENLSQNPKAERSTNGLFFGALSNCHKCTDSGKVPFMFVNGGGAEGVITGLTAFYATVSGAYSTASLNSPLYDTNCEAVTGGPMSSLFPIAPNVVTNCAVWAFDASQFGIAAKYAFCVACAPGFVATRDATHKAKVTACVAITTGMVQPTPPIFNQGVCDKANNYVFSFSSASGTPVIDLTTCILKDLATDCFAAASRTGNCEVCGPSAILNTTTTPYTCQKITVPGCTSVTSTDSRDKNFGAIALYLGGDIGTCNACSSGLVPAEGITVIGTNTGDANHMVCVISSRQLSPSTAPVISKCGEVKYNLIEKRYECTLCTDGWVLAKDGNCADPVLVPNCLLAKTGAGTICDTCKPTFISVSGRCLANPDSNCLTWYESSGELFLRCQQCANNFYEKWDPVGFVSRCVDASSLNMTNCITYSTQQNDPYKVSCIGCSANFFPVVTKDDVTVCFPRATEIMSCATWDVASLASDNFLTCTKCNTPATNSPRELTSYEKSICIGWAQDPNCQAYNFYDDVADSSTYLSKDFTFKCDQCNPGFYFNKLTNLCTPRLNIIDPLCSMYDPFSDMCNQCISDYYLSASKTNCIATAAVRFSNSNYSAFVDSCSLMHSCTTDFVPGLDLVLSSYVSCHRCLNTAEIPFVFVRGGAPYTRIMGLVDYGLGTNATSMDFGKYGHSTACLVPQASVFGIPGSSFNFPVNCAVGVANGNSALDATHSNQPANVNLSRIAVFCGACQPGFRAVGGVATGGSALSPIPNFISSCQQIPNCESSNWFNSCSQCSPGFAWLWNATTGTNYDTCIPVPANPDCQAFNPATNACVLCRHGTVLNKDFYCDRVRAPRCTEGSQVSRTFFITADLPLLTKFNDRLTGCFACESGFTPVLNTGNRFVCTESMYQSLGLASATTALIQNCRNYFVDALGVLKCFACRNNWIPLLGNGLCISAPNLPNCTLAVDAKTCYTCADGFVLVNQMCQPQNIPFCVSYLSSLSSVTQICLGCKIGYYLEANKCFPGDVANCLIYETKIRCNVCKPGFQLAIRKDGADYCYPLDPQLGCAAFDPVEFQKANLVCQTCASRLSVVESTPRINANFCLRFSQIMNCAVYDIVTTINAIADSGFGCLQCTKSFYLVNSTCVPRTALTNDCLTYAVNSDSCKVCRDQMYVNAEGGCTPYNSGILGCVSYSSATYCSVCDQDTYPSKGTCLKIPSGQTIPNCLNYETLGACQRCRDGYMVQGTGCALIQAQNCLVAASPYQCDSCPAGYILTSSLEFLNCVAGNIANCVEYEAKEPPRCNVCQKNFYPDELGQCIAVTTPIEYCLVYDTNSTCVRCDSNTALNANKTACLTQTQTFHAIDYNCDDSAETAKPVCSVCTAGYYFNAGGECVECSSLMTGCLVCNPLQPDVCLLCGPGYFMNNQGDCVVSYLLTEVYEQAMASQLASHDAKATNATSA